MYGYDEYTLDDNLYDDYFYVETTKPLFVKESFDNATNALLTEDESSEELRKKYTKCVHANHGLKHQGNRLKNMVKDSYDEFLELQTHTHILYMLLFIAIIIIINQKINLGNLQHCVDILKLQHTNIDMNAPLRNTFMT